MTGAAAADFQMLSCFLQRDSRLSHSKQPPAFSGRLEFMKSANGLRQASKMARGLLKRP